MKLSDRAEEILETLYLETVENEKHPDISGRQIYSIAG